MSQAAEKLVLITNLLRRMLLPSSHYPHVRDAALQSVLTLPSLLQRGIRLIT